MGSTVYFFSDPMDNTPAIPLTDLEAGALVVIIQESMEKLDLKIYTRCPDTGNFYWSDKIVCGTPVIAGTFDRFIYDENLQRFVMAVKRYGAERIQWICFLLPASINSKEDCLFGLCAADKEIFNTWLKSIGAGAIIFKQ